MISNKKLKVILENLFNEFNIRYEYIDINDDDVNYLINIQYHDSDIIKSIGSINAIIYCSTKENSITIGCTSLYKLVDSDSLLSTLIAINNANQKILYGNIFLRKSNNEISYYYRNNFNNIIDDLNHKNFGIIINSLLSAVINLFSEIKKIEKHEK